MLRHLYYADLNCPFCYALQERLSAEDLWDRVEWRGICHVAPDAIHQVTHTSLELSVQAVRRKAPGLEIQVPPRFIDSTLPTLTIAQVSLRSPEAGAALRGRLYQAYWLNGEDISDPTVVAAACRGLAIEPTPAEALEAAEAKRLVAGWQVAWEKGGFDRRLPVLVSPNGASAIGLDDARRTVLFLKAGVLSSVDADHCRAPVARSE